MFYLWVNWVFVWRAVESLAELPHSSKRFIWCVLIKMTQPGLSHDTLHLKGLAWVLFIRDVNIPEWVWDQRTPFGECRKRTRKYVPKSAHQSVNVAQFMLHKVVSDVQEKPGGDDSASVRCSLCSGCLFAWHKPFPFETSHLALRNLWAHGRRESQSGLGAYFTAE